MSTTTTTFAPENRSAPMTVQRPHFLLYSQTGRKKNREEWSFVLKAADGSAIVKARDIEPDARGERLELLAIVRGLEALDQPSAVSVLTTSRYVNQGVEYGLDEWRRNGWNWECFGHMVPIKNRDLWQRLDRARRVHQVKIRWRRVDTATGDQTEPRVIFHHHRQQVAQLPVEQFKPQATSEHTSRLAPQRTETPHASRSPQSGERLSHWFGVLRAYLAPAASLFPWRLRAHPSMNQNG